MVDILPAAPHGTTDQMSPDRAAVPLETSGGQLTVCTQSGSNAAFLSVVIPSGGAWLAVQQGQWDVYKAGDRPIVRVIATEGLEPTGDRITLTAKVLDASEAVVADETLSGAVAG